MVFRFMALIIRPGIFAVILILWKIGGVSLYGQDSHVNAHSDIADKMEDRSADCYPLELWSIFYHINNAQF